MKVEETAMSATVNSARSQVSGGRTYQNGLRNDRIVGNRRRKGRSSGFTLSERGAFRFGRLTGWRRCYDGLRFRIFGVTRRTGFAIRAGRGSDSRHRRLICLRSICYNQGCRQQPNGERDLHPGTPRLQRVSAAAAGSSKRFPSGAVN